MEIDTNIGVIKKTRIAIGIICTENATRIATKKIDSTKKLGNNCWTISIPSPWNNSFISLYILKNMSLQIFLPIKPSIIFMKPTPTIALVTR